MLNINKHKEILNGILIDIYRNTKLAPYLGFKWWTACMYFYGLDRFSTDLDFDLLDSWKLENVQIQLEKILKKHGTIKNKYLRENTIFFLLSYWILDMNVKIEISRRNYPNKYDIINWKWFSVKIMEKSYILSHKMVALTDRTKLANRDIYDIYYFLSHHWTWSEEIIKFRTWLNSREYITKMIEFLKSKKNVNILDHIWEVLFNNKQKYFVKNNLLEELIVLLKKYE